MIYDVFSFNGEYDLLEIRLNSLDKYVDQFIICEAPTTFVGSPKQLYYNPKDPRYERFWTKIKYFIIDENYTEEEVKEAYESKYTNGEQRWVREYLQKEALKKAMGHIKNEDTVYIGDVDEIWEPYPFEDTRKLNLHVYTYYLNNLSSEEFWGPIVAKWGNIKDKCLNNVRNDTSLRTKEYYGCHFTNQGGLAAVEKKLIDQYNHETFTSQIIAMLPQRFGVVDFIGRNFTFTKDESNWPQWLKDNRQKYMNMLY